MKTFAFLNLGEGNFFTENVDVRGIEKVVVDARLGAFCEATAADGEALTYCISSSEDALFIRVGCPDWVVLNNFYYDSVLRNREKVIAEVFAVQALLPDAPEHPVETEGGEVGADLLLVL